MDTKVSAGIKAESDVSPSATWGAVREFWRTLGIPIDLHSQEL